MYTIINKFERAEILDSYIVKIAEVEDIKNIIDLIYETELNPNYEWGYGTEADQKEKLNILLNTTNTRFKLNNILVCKKENQFCGFILSLGGKNIKKETLVSDFNLIKMEKNLNFKFKFLLDTICYIFYKECAKNEYYISNIAVKKEFRGMGIAHKLLYSSYELAKNKGYDKIVLHANNDRLVDYYKNFGFKIYDLKSKKMTKDL